MSMNRALGRLEKVNIRELCIHEQYDFSNWVAKKENIELLNDTVGLRLTDLEKEVYVGSYRCDLVAMDETTGMKVIIENQQYRASWLAARAYDQRISDKDHAVRETKLAHPRRNNLSCGSWQPIYIKRSTTMCRTIRLATELLPSG